MGLLAELFEHWEELLLFDVAQQTIEIEVVELQVEVGGHEAGHVGIVVLFIEVEQLLMLGRHDGEAFPGQLLLKVSIELNELLRV